MPILSPFSKPPRRRGPARSPRAPQPFTKFDERDISNLLNSPPILYKQVQYFFAEKFVNYFINDAKITDHLTRRAMLNYLIYLERDTPGTVQKLLGAEQLISDLLNKQQTNLNKKILGIENK